MVRLKKPASRYTFEPKIPQPVHGVSLESTESREALPKEHNELTPKLVGQRTEDHPFALREEDGFLFSLPGDIGATKVVVYEDGSCGLRVGDGIYPIAARFIGESLVIEYKESAYNIGSLNFQLAPQVRDDMMKNEA